MTLRPAIPADGRGLAAIRNPIIRVTPVTFNSAEKTPDAVAALIATRAAAGH